MILKKMVAFPTKFQEHESITRPSRRSSSSSSFHSSISFSHPTMLSLCLLIFLIFSSSSSNNNHFLFGHAKEIEATNEWQLLGENDTIPAGLHVRMDMTTGEKWVKLIDNDDDDDDKNTGTTTTSTTEAAAATAAAAAVIQENGAIQLVEKNEADSEDNKKKYNYEVMHRTLSKLPDEEKDRMGGLPELPQSKGSITITRKEREAFEKRMAEIWEKRQQELKELQEQMLDLPEVLKERIKSIREYLKNPSTHLESMDLDANDDDIDGSNSDGDLPHFVSVLKDLEFLLTDIDMARDFHTLGGWGLLTSLLSEDVHVPQNKTLSKLSRRTEEKIRAVQAHAAWAIGTAVKNTGELFPYAVEPVSIIVAEKTKKITTPIDLLVDAFCHEYKDPNAWQVRNLLAKSIYAIGSLLRGNRLSQSHISRNDVPARLGGKLRELSLGRFSSSNTKLVQKLLSLAGDVISDVNIHKEELDEDVREAIIKSFSTDDWCSSTMKLLTMDTFLPVNAQETLLESTIILGPYCDWEKSSSAAETSIVNIRNEWQNNSADFDSDHLGQLVELAEKALLLFNNQSQE